VDRILPLIPKERTVVVTAQSHAEGVLELLPDLDEKNMLIEPEGKNTAPALAYAAALLLERDPDAVMVVLPSDHVIGAPEKLLAEIRSAADLAKRKRLLITFGIRPTRPEPGFGYIEVGGKIERNVFRVRSFKEKPNRKKARDYIDSGRYLWNSGMFVFRCDVLMEKIREHIPALYSAWKTYSESGKGQNDLERFYGGATAISIDYGVMEKCTADSAVVSASFKWYDVGSWKAIDDLWEPDEAGNRANNNILVAVNSTGNTVVSKKLVALLGVDDLTIVETDDALLVCKKERAQEIKSLVDEIERQGLKEYL
jgi:mannose-1-phosphate guanylyltransferase